MSSTTVYPLSTLDAGYLKRNGEFADKHSYTMDGIFLAVFVLIIGRSIQALRKTEFGSFYFKTEIMAILISLGMIIYISIHLSVKVKVDKLRKH